MHNPFQLRVFARVLCADCWICPHCHTRTTNYQVARSSWHRSMLSSPICDQAKIRHKETKERVRSTTDERVLRAPLTAYSCSLEAEKQLPAFALPPTRRPQPVVLLSISRNNSSLKLQAREHELLQRRGRVLTHLSSLPPNSSKQQAPLISLLLSTRTPGLVHLRPLHCTCRLVNALPQRATPQASIGDNVAVDVTFLEPVVTLLPWQLPWSIEVAGILALRVHPGGDQHLALLPLRPPIWEQPLHREQSGVGARSA